MNDLTDEELAGSWADLPNRASAPLGQVPVGAVRFDDTRRQSIDGAVLSSRLPARAS